MIKCLILCTAQIAIVAMLVCCNSPEETEVPQSTHPVWSPDGSKIAFINNKVGVENGNPINFEVFTMNTDGTNMKRHTDNTAFEADISWSPNSNMLAVKSYRDGNDEVYTIDLVTGEQTNISNHLSRDDSPTWSSDGDAIYFSSQRDNEQGELYSYAIESKELTRLTTNDFAEIAAVWSPDGSQIAFVSDIDGDDDIYVIDLLNQQLTQVTNNELNDWYPIWSPDGKTILYTYGDWNTDIWELRTIAPDGSNEETILIRTDSGNATWSPDGNQIAYGSSKNGTGEIYVYNLENRSERQITK
ncbi:MAG: DPP IV N-terminal domain-containing protein [Cyclobacteriaceae bacterium]